MSQFWENALLTDWRTDGSNFIGSLNFSSSDPIFYSTSFQIKIKTSHLKDFMSIHIPYFSSFRIGDRGHPGFSLFPLEMRGGIPPLMKKVVFFYIEIKGYQMEHFFKKFQNFLEISCPSPPKNVCPWKPWHPRSILGASIFLHPFLQNLKISIIYSVFIVILWSWSKLVWFRNLKLIGRNFRKIKYSH